MKGRPRISNDYHNRIVDYQKEDIRRRRVSGVHKSELEEIYDAYSQVKLTETVRKKLMLLFLLEMVEDEVHDARFHWNWAIYGIECFLKVN